MKITKMATKKTVKTAETEYRRWSNLMHSIYSDQHVAEIKALGGYLAGGPTANGGYEARIVFPSLPPMTPEDEAILNQQRQRLG